MKTLRKIVLVLGLPALLSAAVFAESAAELLSEAQAAYLRGDMETAKRNFELVYRMDPRNATAIGYLRRIKMQEAKMGAGPKQEKVLAALIIPQVQFKEATLGAALEYLKQAAAKASDGKTAVNFVVAPEIPVDTTIVTLSLANVPFTEVLRYVGNLANVTFSYDQYAISVKPKSAAAAATTTAPASVQ